MADPTFPLFPILSSLGFFLVLIPLPWHLEAWNSGTCFYMIWTALACLNQSINSTVWARDAVNRAPIWCEISIRIILGASVAIPASSLCIMRRLYNIARIKNTTITDGDKRRAVLIDSLICVLFPLVFIAMQYIVQGHRFNIYEELGCYPAIVNTIVVYFTSAMWPAIIGLCSAVYCVLSIRWFLIRRAELDEFLRSNGSVTRSRYLRLMAMAMTEVLCTTPLAVFSIVLNAIQGVEPWMSWADIHYNYSRVDQIASVLWRHDRGAVLAFELNRWSPVACAFIFFAFFGFAQEACKHYLATFWFFSRLLGFSKQSKGSSLSSSLGIYARRKPRTTTQSSLTESTAMPPVLTDKSSISDDSFMTASSSFSSDEKTSTLADIPMGCVRVMPRQIIVIPTCHHTRPEGATN